MILFDSDKNHARSRINATKQRLRDEFNRVPDFAWITKGREVDNYLEYDKLEISVKQVHPSASNLLSKEQYSNLLVYQKRNSSKPKTASKVKVAKNYTENNDANLDILDLRNQITQLCDSIMSIYVENLNQ